MHGRGMLATLMCALVVTGCASRPAPPATSGAPAPPSEITLVATGDVLVHTEITDQARADGRGGLDFAPLLAGLRPTVESADLAVCHLETPLAASPDGPFAGYPSFSAPPQVAAGLRATGYDACSTASNHTYDQGSRGITSTLDTLDAAGLRHVGSARAAAESGPLMLSARGVRVGWLSAAYGSNGTAPPADRPWQVEGLDPARLLAHARQARAAGAEIVVASLHWGTEYESAATDEQRSLARRLLADPDVDLVVGHHAHVVQPFEKIGDEWVAYGLGNSIAHHDVARGTTEEGVAARFTFGRGGDGRWTVTRAEAVPTLVERDPPVRIRDVSGATDPRALEARRRTADVVGSLGAAPVTR